MVGNSDDIGEFQFDPTEFEFAWSRIVATRNELLSIGFAGLVSRITDIASTVTLLRSPIVHDVRQRITAAESALRKLQRQITVSGQAQVAAKLESAIATSRPMREIFEEISTKGAIPLEGNRNVPPSIFPPGHPDRIASGGTIPIEGSSAAAFTSQIGGDFGGEGTGFVPPPTVPLPTPGTGADTIPPDENASCPVGPGECHTLNFAGAITVRDTTTGALRKESWLVPHGKTVASLSLTTRKRFANSWSSCSRRRDTMSKTWEAPRLRSQCTATSRST